MAEETNNEIQWTIHTTNPELVKPAREKLAEVVDPEIGMNIIQLGLVRDISVENGVARMKMILTTPFCPYGPWLVQQVKETSEKASGRETKVEVVPEQWNPEMMEDPTLLGFF